MPGKIKERLDHERRSNGLKKTRLKSKTRSTELNHAIVVRERRASWVLFLVMCAHKNVTSFITAIYFGENHRAMRNTKNRAIPV
jgi:hypothetical protein